MAPHGRYCPADLRRRDGDAFGAAGAAGTLLGHTSEARWLRFADEHLRHLFPYLPKQPGYTKRLRRLAATPARGNAELADRTRPLATTKVRAIVSGGVTG